MECYNLQRQAACLKRSLFDQACILFFSSIVVEKIMWFVFVQVLQYSYQYILCAIGATLFFFFFWDQLTSEAMQLYFSILSIYDLFVLSFVQLWARSRNQCSCNFTFQSFLSIILQSFHISWQKAKKNLKLKMLN